MTRMILRIAATVLAMIVATPGYAAEQVTAKDVLERLKALDGKWQSERIIEEGSGSEDAEPAPKVDHQFEVTGGGSVVVETMFQGTPSEMINMIHLDGEELLLTHYCAGGNQPQMRLNRERSTPDHLIFDFIGGTNLAAETDGHIHNAEIFLTGNDQLKSEWTGYSEGKPVGVSAFTITRAE